MTKAQLIGEISSKTAIQKEIVSDIIESYIEVVKSSLAEGNDIYIRGFGSFNNKIRQQKIARDIRRGKTIVIPAHYLPSFKPAPDFKEKVRSSQKLQGKIIIA
jgi:DNA-binding protein HU-beta